MTSFVFDTRDRPKPRYRLNPEDRADEATRKIIGPLLQTVRINVDGVLEDLDPEFLHDLRVACRRTRSALSQLKGVLPHGAADDLVAETKWLGGVTGPCRDLDVFLLELESYRVQLGNDARSLTVFERLLRHERCAALGRVQHALRSDRFERMLEAWGRLASSVRNGIDPPEAELPIVDIAGQKVLKAYTKMVKRGTRLADPPPPREMHRLRIDAKKLRYLLEFFSSLYPKKTLKQLIKELKHFQDILGGFNDAVVQQHYLASIAEELRNKGSARPDTVAAMSRLADAMTGRQEGYRQSFTGRFEVFSNRQSRALYRETFGTT